MIEIEIDIASFRQDSRKYQDCLFSGNRFQELIGTVFGGNPQHWRGGAQAKSSQFAINSNLVSKNGGGVLPWAVELCIRLSLGEVRGSLTDEIHEIRIVAPIVQV